MFVTKTSLPRRTFLRGLGVALGVPLLDAMVPALTVAGRTAARPEVPVRGHLRAARHDHGSVDAGDRRCARAEADHGVARAVQGADARRQQPGPARGGVRHQPCRSACLVADGRRAEAHRRSRLPARGHGRSSDRRSSIGQDTTFPSLEVATEDFTALLGSCAPGYSCAYANTLSWQGPTIAAADGDQSARAVRTDVRRREHGGAAARAHAARIAASSISSRKMSRSSRRGIGQNDRARLGQYLDNVREVERRIQRAEKQAQSSVDVPDAPVGVPESYEEHVGVLYDLLALAYEIDLTRVFTFMMARELSQRTYPHIDATLPHHMLSHHANNPDRIAAHARVNTYHVQLFGKFLRTAADDAGRRRLAARPLDDSLWQWHGQRQRARRLSAADAPRRRQGARAPATGTCQAPENSPNANLMLSMVDRFGIETGTLWCQHRTGRDLELQAKVYALQEDETWLLLRWIVRRCVGCRAWGAGGPFGVLSMP